MSGPYWLLAETHRLLLSSSVLKNEDKRVTLMGSIVFPLRVNIGLSKITNASL